MQNDPPLTRKRIVYCVLINLMATPGLGSIMAGRRIAGWGQLILSLVGFVLLLVWFYKLVVVQFYGQMFGEVALQPEGKIGLAGGIFFASSWLWTLVTSLDLLRLPARVSLQSLENFAGGLMKATESQITTALAQLPEWRRNGDVIARTFQFKDFPAAMKFVNDVAQIAEQAQHHPDVDIRWNKVSLALSTHDVGGLTQKDFALAGECDALAG